jgi:hypothetical protein
MAKHAAFSVFMRKQRTLEIEQGIVQPPKVKAKKEKKKGLGSRKYRKALREGKFNQ